MRAAIFDMDGLLIDSEPLWREAEIEVFASVGLALSDEECRDTTGLRIDEVVALRHAQSPWSEPELGVVIERITDALIARVRARGEPLPGAREAIATCRSAGLALALASSSSRRIIDATLEHLGLEFPVIASAQDERYGKPHPAVFLRAAERLGVEPTECLVFEDSLHGVIAAKAARMTVIAVPEHPDPRFAIADRVLESLLDYK